MKKVSQLFSSFIFILLILSGCTGIEQQLEAPEEFPVMMYRSTPAQKLTYHVKDIFTQEMEIQGQKAKTKVTKEITVSMVSSEFDNGKLNFDSVIDEVSIEVSSDPGGDITPELDKIPGIPFEIRIDQLGNELEIIGTEALKYSLGQSGERTLENDFQHFFPTLPGHGLNIGDTWTTIDTLDLSEGYMNLDIVIVSNNKLGGYERIGERECARIEVEYTSTVLSSGIQQSANFTTSVEITGSETWYFDYIQGVYVKLTSLGSGEGTVKVSGPQNMTIPLSQTISIEVSLIE